MDAKVDQFIRQINAFSDRANSLCASNSESVEQSQALAEALEELGTALTELRIAEEELRAQNEELVVAQAAIETERKRYQELFDFAPDAYIVTSPQGIIRSANRAATTLLKVEQKFLIGKPLINFIPVEQRSAFRSQLLRLLQIERLQDWEVLIKTRDGGRIDAAISVVTVRDTAGQPVGWRWLIRDITARKQAEEKLRQIQLQNLQLQEAAKMKSQFLALMSHELRTPMNAIIGFSQLLLRHNHNSLTPQQTSMVQRILNGGKHLLSLIEEILSYSQLEAGALKLETQQFNLAELVKTTTAELSCLAEQKNLTLQAQSFLENSLVVNDCNRVRQILVNLLSNAIKFTESGSVQVEVRDLAERVVIVVKDTGIGIPQDKIAHIFEEFRQLDEVKNRKYGGTGLGLTIVDRLVRMMKGKITVISELGQGSTFVVELPRCVRGEG